MLSSSLLASFLLALPLSVLAQNSSSARVSSGAGGNSTATSVAPVISQSYSVSFSSLNKIPGRLCWPLKVGMRGTGLPFEEEEAEGEGMERAQADLPPSFPPTVPPSSLSSLQLFETLVVNGTARSQITSSVLVNYTVAANTQTVSSLLSPSAAARSARSALRTSPTLLPLSFHRM